MATTSLPRGKSWWVSEVATRSSLLRAGSLSAAAAQCVAPGRTDYEPNLLLRGAGLLFAATAAQRWEGTITQATYLMRVKSVQSLELIIAPIWVPCRSERNGEALATVNCYLAPFANIPSNRRGSEFEFGDALNEPWERDAGFPQFNSTSDKTDSGFLLVRCKIW